MFYCCLLSGDGIFSVANSAAIGGVVEMVGGIV